MKKIVIINGTGGCGKDTFVEYCKKYGRVFNFSSIDKVKEIAKIIGWTGTKSEKDRKFLADLKKLTTDFNDMAFNSIKEAVDKFHNSDDEFMFIHIREPEEIERAVETFKAQSLLIKRENQEIIKSNYSDASVENYIYDYIIINTTLEELEESAKKFIEELRDV
ncbi:MAG: hypothetical protein IJR82_00075 [Bacilli bacterium]|nr:hypothetical protein [Bacilli bacterium]